MGQFRHLVGTQLVVVIRKQLVLVVHNILVALGSHNYLVTHRQPLVVIPQHKPPPQ
jgi:hypothetical protein